MDAEKAARANSMHRRVQFAHIRSIVEMHHSSSSEQMLESYRAAFDSHMARPGRSLDPERPDRQVPENVLRLLSAEAVVIQEILANCYAPDRQMMLANLEGNPGLLEKMPLITDYLPLKPKG